MAEVRARRPDPRPPNPPDCRTEPSFRSSKIVPGIADGANLHQERPAEPKALECAIERP
jgi:hypothetical protein